MAQQPYSEKKWSYPIAEDYGLGDADNGNNNIPMFMIRMMLKVKASLPGDEYSKYKYAFRRAADHYYRNGFINIMNGSVEIVHKGVRYELESRQRADKTNKDSAVIDAPAKQREFNYWVKAATNVRISQSGV
jgi:hypothetical protein